MNYKLFHGFNSTTVQLIQKHHPVVQNTNKRFNSTTVQLIQTEQSKQLQ